MPASWPIAPASVSLARISPDSICRRWKAAFATASHIVRRADAALLFRPHLSASRGNEKSGRPPGAPFNRPNVKKIGSLT